MEENYTIEKDDYLIILQILFWNHVHDSEI